MVGERPSPSIPCDQLPFHTLEAVASILFHPWHVLLKQESRDLPGHDLAARGGCGV